VLHIVDSDMCGATVHRKHCCVFMAVLSIFVLLLTNICMSKIQRISIGTIVMQMHHSIMSYIHCPYIFCLTVHS